MAALTSQGCAEEEAPPLELFEPCDGVITPCVEPLECVEPSGSGERSCNRTCNVDTVVFGNDLEQEVSQECPDTPARYCYDGVCHGEFGDG